MLQKTPFGFDVSVWEFFLPLLAGAELVMARPGGHQEPDYLAQVMRDARITLLHFVPSMLDVFLEHRSARDFPDLRRVLCSGEALPRSLQRRFEQQLAGIELHNLYGPTEAAIDVTAWQCRPGDPGESVPIGRPIANIQMYVLDALGQVQPLGVAGELHIGGIGVARGYLNLPELSAERFIADPFSNDPQARLYKTGDLGRWLANGALEDSWLADRNRRSRGRPGLVPRRSRSGGDRPRGRRPTGQQAPGGLPLWGTGTGRTTAQGTAQAPARIHDPQRLRASGESAAVLQRQAGPQSWTARPCLHRISTR